MMVHSLGSAGTIALVLLAVSGPSSAACAQAADAPAPTTAAAVDVLPAFRAALGARRDEIVALRRDIHRHPEPSGEEDRTAAIAADVLREAGFEVTTGVGGHGVVGVLRGGAPGAADGPVLAFRADMDAVRDGANDPMPFRSTVPGVNHICGHDIHTSIGFALAAGLGAVRDRLAGTVVLVFQPAEETASGANAMLADGAFDGAASGLDGAPDAIFAYHTAPLEVGQIMTRPGPLLTGRDRVLVTLRGAGDPGDVDLAAVASRARYVVAGVATADASERSRPVGEEFVVARGLRATQAGRSRWEIGAVLTTSSVAASRKAYEEIARGLAALEREHEGIAADLSYEERFIAGLDNDPALVARANAVARRVLGDAAVRAPQTLSTMFSEDFGSFQREAPGVMWFLGVSNAAEGWVGMPHTPGYAADEEAIFVGAEVMAAVMLDLMAGDGQVSRGSG